MGMLDGVFLPIASASCGRQPVDDNPNRACQTQDGVCRTFICCAVSVQLGKLAYLTGQSFTGATQCKKARGLLVSYFS